LTKADEKILEATIQLVSDQGVDKLTFASLGEQVELSPSTLVQRFGTKQRLLSLTTKHCLQSMGAIIETSQNESHSPLQAAYAAFASMAQAVTGVREFANGQVFFYLALTDPDTYAILQTSMRQACEKTQQLLDEAVVAHELKPCDTTALALTLQTTYEGAITTWLAYQEGSVEEWVTKRLTAVVEPYKTNEI